MVWMERFLQYFTERNMLILMASIFILLSLAVALVPYDPSMDLADATTNDIWVEQYANGIHYIPYDEWDYGQTQSVVVEYQDQYVVVNEKGPGHVAMMLPFYMAGIGGFFPVLMMGLAVLGTYMLGKRLFSWQIGFLASFFVMFNLVVIAMWHRYYWTDASTMHLMVMSAWLLVEANYQYNGCSLDPSQGSGSPNQRLRGIILCMLSGVVFGLSVSTRYPTGLLILALMFYLIGFYTLRSWPFLRSGKFRQAIKTSMPLIALVFSFTVGLFIVLAPLLQYNSTYFGGPFNSGYDATTLMEFGRTGTIDVRNTTASWTSNLGSYVTTAFTNLVRLLPTLVGRMPALILAPMGIYCLRKRKLELSFLIIWIGINWFTYLSLDWVDMYARPDLVPFEPRYWLPSLPAIAMLGAIGAYRLSRWAAINISSANRFKSSEKNFLRLLITGALAGIIVLWGAVPAASYLQDPQVNGDPNGQPQAQIVTTDMLLANPQDYVGEAVMLQDAEIVAVSLNMLEVRSANALNPESIQVRFIEWPPGTLPQLSIGQHVEVQGMWDRYIDNSIDNTPVYNLNVKFDTRDFVRIIQ